MGKSVVAQRVKRARERDARLAPRRARAVSFDTARQYVRHADVPKYLLANYDVQRAYALFHCNRFVWFLERTGSPLIEQCHRDRGKTIYVASYWSRIVLFADVLQSYARDSGDDFREFVCRRSLHAQSALAPIAQRRWVEAERARHALRREAFAGVDFLMREGFRVRGASISSWKCWSFVAGEQKYTYAMPEAPPTNVVDWCRSVPQVAFRTERGSLLTLGRFMHLVRALRARLPDAILLLIVRFTTRERAR